MQFRTSSKTSVNYLKNTKAIDYILLIALLKTADATSNLEFINIY